MSKYDNYGEFMISVLDEAEIKCKQCIYGSLFNIFGVNGANEK